ncbi:MAG: sulfite exporter TauE/SafE family protein [Chloroflexi bacterium]|nr:sulfite exporter TauE/SafE family protein [Chloroflexota bacterium]
MEALLLAALFLAAAALYASVGHAGASAYLAAMALVGVTPETMRPTALTLNLFVAGIVVVRFASAGHLPWRSLVPLVVASVPAAFVGGLVQLPNELYRPLVALVLIVGAWRLATRRFGREPVHARVPILGGLAAGGAIGLLAGLTGTGGGIFLTPLLVMAGWAPTRQAAGLSGAFILANSVAGLGGVLVGGLTLPRELPLWVLAVGVGGLAGSWLGAARFSVLTLRRTLAVVLVVAAAKLVFLP